ncbi:type II secretion system protein [Candidatus Parcubacteria bacterium]|nr:MAG: type II secretion system protein [Candidatus Parcubacteria bacterium]
MNRISSQYKSGFTLIELLVVIAIIAIVSTLAVVNLNQARAKARDARRLSDIGQLKKALEIYYYTNGEYPNADECHHLPAICLCTSITATPITAWIPDLTDQIDQPLPVDPINTTDPDTSKTYAYIYTRLDSTPVPPYEEYYYIVYRLETEDQRNDCNGRGYPGWSCTGGGNMPPPL